MRCPITRIATIAAISSTVVVGAPLAAQADTPGCVTRAEYSHVHKGTTKARVSRIFDTSGHRQVIARSGRFTSEIRSYRTCSRYSVVSISFGNGKLDAKSAVWVH